MVGQYEDDPQSWNLFAYARNNPLIYVDPTGHDWRLYNAVGKEIGVAKTTEELEKLGYRYYGSNDDTGDLYFKDGDNNRFTAVYFEGDPGPAERVQAQYTISRFADGVGAELDRSSGASMRLIGGFAAVTYVGGAAIGAGVFYAPVAVELVRRAATQVDSNKLNHIFGKAEHNLGNLVRQFGSRERAFNAIQQATQAAVKNQGLQGAFETTVKVGTETITVRGAVVDGVVKIGTAFKP